MKKRLFQSLTLLLALTLTACNNNDTDTMNNSMDNSQQEEASSGADSGGYAEIGSGAHLVKFPDLDNAIVFTTYDRGEIHENIYVNSREAIEAVQNGEELPSGTVITLEGYKDGELEHYLVMEKRTGWGSQYSPKERTGEWELQAFTPDREVMEDGIGGPAIGRCYSCHANQERNEFMNSYDALKEFDLGTLSQSNSSSKETPIAAIPAEDWEVTAIPAQLNNSMDVSHKEIRSIGGEEKAGILQDVLLTMYLHQYTN